MGPNFVYLMLTYQCLWKTETFLVCLLQRQQAHKRLHDCFQKFWVQKIVSLIWSPCTNLRSGHFPCVQKNKYSAADSLRTFCSWFKSVICDSVCDIYLRGHTFHVSSKKERNVVLMKTIIEHKKTKHLQRHTCYYGTYTLTVSSQRRSFAAWLIRNNLPCM